MRTGGSCGWRTALVVVIFWAASSSCKEVTDEDIAKARKYSEDIQSKVVGDGEECFVSTFGGSITVLKHIYALQGSDEDIKEKYKGEDGRKEFKELLKDLKDVSEDPDNIEVMCDFTLGMTCGEGKCASCSTLLKKEHELWKEECDLVSKLSKGDENGGGESSESGTGGSETTTKGSGGMATIGAAAGVTGLLLGLISLSYLRMLS